MAEKIVQSKDRFSLLAIWGFLLAVAAGLAAVTAGVGSYWGWWTFRTGFVILRWAAYGGILALVISLAGCLLTRPGVARSGFIWSVFGLLIALLTVIIPWSHWRLAQSVPPIHDITTDTENPPGFVVLLPLRKDAPNTADYGGREVAAKQRTAYPELVPLVLPLPPDQVFIRALKQARSLGWEIVAADPTGGRIEATDTTFWFRFKDDIVIRIKLADGGSRLDIRSVSRVGKGDLGTNARRIRKFIRALKKEI
ncbi:MAG: DUF1499 domain-containing protein [Deltaproteobacteria bacterium]|nr:DUF1499 domain-containing protein [Deltaproteobacteria bacterium]